MGQCLGVGQANNECSLHSTMSKLSDVRGRFPKAYCISKYDGTETVSSQNCKGKQIR